MTVRVSFAKRVVVSTPGRMPTTFGMALGPWIGGWLYDARGRHAWMFIGSSAIGLGAVAG